SRGDIRGGCVLQVYLKGDARREAPNLAASAFSRSGVCTSLLRGPLIVMVGGYSNDYKRDIDMRDARSAADYFSSAYRYSYPDPHLESQLFLGVRVATCEELIRLDVTGNDTYQVFSGWDAIFRAEASQISNLLGIPILVRPNAVPNTTSIVSSGVWSDGMTHDYDSDDEDENDEVQSDDSAAMLLMRNLTCSEAGSQGFGSVPRGCKRACTVWAVRADGLPLPHQHIEALVGYIRERIEPRLNAALAGIANGKVVPDRESVLNSITKAEFQEYFEPLKARKSVEEPGWALIPSPYAMNRGFLRAMDSLKNDICMVRQMARMRV
ncbi:hypothetical protein H2200_003688, partial [Cladophialophora chaetospira]